MEEIRKGNLVLANNMLVSIKDFKDSDNKMKFINAHCFVRYGNYNEAIETVCSLDGKCKVYFNSNEGYMPYDCLILDINTYSNEIEEPSMDAYEFIEWSIDAYKFEENNYYLKIKSVAVYDIIKYNITYNLNGGSELEDVTLIENDCLSNEYVSMKDNYTFGAWYYDVEFSQAIEYDKPLRNLTVYAKWNEETNPSYFEYRISRNKITLITFKNSITDTIINIPSHNGGYEVTSLGDSIFENCSSLTSIGENAFVSSGSMRIYCKAESQPYGWNYYWNHNPWPVVWGYES